jgi:hypothetical protein
MFSLFSISYLIRHTFQAKIAKKNEKIGLKVIFPRSSERNDLNISRGKSQLNEEWTEAMVKIHLLLIQHTGSRLIADNLLQLHR